MIVQVDPASPVPACEQLRVQIGGLIRSGALAPGVQLPTIRQLATDMHLAKDTVARSYELLERDCLVERQGRRGTAVVDLRTLDADPFGELTQAAAAYALLARQLGVGPETAGLIVSRAILGSR